MKRVKLDEFLAQHQVLVIDGAMSTPLEAKGCDLNDPLWTSKTLIEQPELIKQVHLDYFEAGANCGITASYQSSIAGLTAKGYTVEQAEELIVRSLSLLQEARNEWLTKHPEGPTPLALASCGPYGAYLADGSEYRGNYGVSREVLYDFHYRRAELLWEHGADVLLFETIPSLEEALVCAEVAEKLRADFWISFSCKDGQHIHEADTLISDAANALAGYPHLKMLGVNCTEPDSIESLIKEIKSVTDIPVAVYPNSGEVYDPTTKTWTASQEGKNFTDNAITWLQAGAVGVGGCCTTVASHIEQIVVGRDHYLRK